MERPFHHVNVRREGDVYCVRLRRAQLDESQLYEMCAELVRLVEEDGCRMLVLSLGPPDPEFLYSIFLAKLVSLQRRLQAAGGALKLAGASEATRSIFDACHLGSHFDFAPDEATAIRAFSWPGGNGPSTSA